MNSTNKIPKPAESGSDGSQNESSSGQDLIQSDQLSGHTLAQTVRGLTVSRNRPFGSDVTSELMAGITSHLEKDLHLTKNQLSQLRCKFEDKSEALSDERVKNGVLNAQLNAYKSIKHLRNFGIAVGTLLATSSITFFNNEQMHSYGYLSLSIGLLLIIISWFSPSNGAKK